MQHDNDKKATPSYEWPVENLDTLRPTEKCWLTGNFTGDEICDFCDHKHECSGYERDDD